MDATRVGGDFNPAYVISRICPLNGSLKLAAVSACSEFGDNFPVKLASAFYQAHLLLVKHPEVPFVRLRYNYDGSRSSVDRWHIRRAEVAPVNDRKRTQEEMRRNLTQSALQVKRQGA